MHQVSWKPLVRNLSSQYHTGASPNSILQCIARLTVSWWIFRIHAGTHTFSNTNTSSNVLNTHNHTHRGYKWPSVSSHSQHFLQTVTLDSSSSSRTEDTPYLLDTVTTRHTLQHSKWTRPSVFRGSILVPSRDCSLSRNCFKKLT